MSASELRYRLPTRGLLLLQAVAVMGGTMLIVGFAQDAKRTWLNVFVISNYLLGLGLAGLLLVALHYVTGARWSIPIRRVPEAMAGGVLIGAVGLAAVLLLCPWLYSGSEAGSSHGAESPLHQFWLSRPFFLGRSFAYIVVWLGFAFSLVRNSHRQDVVTDPGPTVKNTRLSAAFLVIFGVTCWLASYDWIMSLTPNWVSTIFGVYYFASLFLSGLAAAILIVVGLRRFTPLREVVNEDHLHDLGTLLFSFSSFWMYIWFCQYLLIWYVNNPEETAYLRQRQHGQWPVFLFFDLAFNWGIPFLVLLFRSAKRDGRILGTVAVLVLVGRWLDLTIMIVPSQAESAPVPGLLEIGLFIGAAALFLLVVFRSLGRAALLPLHEPMALEKAPQTA